jgi:hypothetical protein
MQDLGKMYTELELKNKCKGKKKGKAIPVMGCGGP